VCRILAYDAEAPETEAYWYEFLGASVPRCVGISQMTQRI
jgi:hypothetical protein